MSLDDKTAQYILDSISLTGEIDKNTAKLQPLIVRTSERVINRSSGLPKIKPYIAERFKLIMAQPMSIKALNSLEIRCCLCGKVISYPCWYGSERLAMNILHYFICWDSKSAQRVNSNCYRRN